MLYNRYNLLGNNRDENANTSNNQRVLSLKPIMNQQQQSLTTNSSSITTSGIVGKSLTSTTINRKALGEITNSSRMSITNLTDSKPTMFKKSTSQKEVLLSTTNKTNNESYNNNHNNNNSTSMNSSNNNSNVKVNVIPSSPIMASPGIDKKDTNDPQSCVPYVKDIIAHYKSIELKYLPEQNYLNYHKFIRNDDRRNMINLLIQIHHRGRFQNESLYLTVNIMDRFLSVHKDVSVGKLCLVAIASLFIATKYEDLRYLSAKDALKVCGDKYTKDELLRMERLILQSLDFNLTIASIHAFLRRYLKCGQCDSYQINIAMYLAEISLLELSMLKYTPSEVACACVYLSKLFFKADKWSTVLQYYSGKTQEEIMPCVKELYSILKTYSTPTIPGSKSDEHNYVYVKYDRESRLGVSGLCAKAVLPKKQ
ncbi:hypothetical protein ABK040_016534 [Willaertia magna]